MKAKLIVEGKEFEIDINNPEIEELIKPEKKTGYERVKCGERYHSIGINGVINTAIENNCYIDIILYDNANYYSDRTIAENNTRADRLMRQLRKFAAENKCKELRWSDTTQWKHYIVWDCGESLGVHHCTTTREPGVVYFDSVETANDAIQTYQDELTWYFTEYKDSL